jgi:hypothetical protein
VVELTLGGALLTHVAASSVRIARRWRSAPPPRMESAGDVPESVALMDADRVLAAIRLTRCIVAFVAFGRILLPFAASGRF